MSSLSPHWPVDSDWSDLLSSTFDQPYFQELTEFVASERESRTIFPPAADVFNAFRFTSFSNTKVVVLGQDPYHGEGQAHGLSFSVVGDCKLPPSLKNIFKELASDLGVDAPTNGDLSSWAKQGVLLLNTVLSVRQSEANSHRKKGWEKFTDEVIRQLGQQSQPIVFILWGKPAEKKTKLIAPHHKVLISPHPSPLSSHRGFFGSQPFSKTNFALNEFGQTPIHWESISEK